jgi:hypothetical protein
MDVGVVTNVMTILAMNYLGLKIDRSTSITLKMVDKQVIKPKQIISSVIIIVMKVSTIGFPCGIRRRWGLPNNIK